MVTYNHVYGVVLYAAQIHAVEQLVSYVASDITAVA